MKKQLLFISILIVTFGLGFAFNNVITKISDKKDVRGRVTGIGGIFFKCKNPKLVREWYSKHLGLNTNDYGAVFEWRQGVDTLKKGFLQWSPFNEKTKYFEPSLKEFMINYRVENLDNLINQLKSEGIVITDSIQTVEYGKFVHIMDLEGNKIELWEPNDLEFEKLGLQIQAKTTK